MPNCQKCGIEISEDGICDSCANAQNQQAPPPSGSGKGGLIAIIAIVVVIIVILAVTLVFFGGGGNRSPTGAMDSFVDNYNSGDIDGALHYTDAHFMSYSEFNDIASDMDEDAEDVSVRNLETRYREDMTSEEIEDAEDTVEGMEEEYGIQVDEFCMVDYTMTADGETHSSDMLSVKVDGKWYMVIFGHYATYHSVSTPVGSWVSIEDTSTTEGKLTFGTFSDSVEPIDIKIFVSDGSTTYEINFNDALSSQTTDLTVSPSGIQAEYYDYNYAGNQINSGDYITLTGLTSGTTYTIELFHIPSDAVIFMVGADDSFTTPSSTASPLGLSDAGRTTTTFTILVASAPDGAMVDGTQFSFTHDNSVTAIDSTTVYGADGIEDASWTSATGWVYTVGNTADTLEFNPGMKITISTTAVSSGDTLIISSSEGYFGTTEYRV